MLREAVRQKEMFGPLFTPTLFIATVNPPQSPPVGLLGSRGVTFVEKRRNGSHGNTSPPETERIVFTNALNSEHSLIDVSRSLSFRILPASRGFT